MFGKSTSKKTPVVGRKTVKSVLTGLCLGIAAIGLAVGGVASTAHASIITTPTDLDPGDEYRLAFVTSTTRDATSTDIGDYNDFVTLAATSQTELDALGADWTAIASTADVDARDNTSTVPGTDGPDGIPIYLLNDTRLADDYADLWDITIIVPLNVTEAGVVWIVPSGVPGTVWSGSRFDGTQDGYPLGTVSGAYGPRTGSHFVGSEWNYWINYYNASASTLLSFYSISSVLTVPLPATISEPGTLILFSFGLALIAVAQWRTRDTGSS